MTLNAKESVGVVIGRFQVDELHAGHTALLDYVSSMHTRMLVFIGMRNTPPTKTNPLSFIVRERMIRESYPNAIILPLEDMRYNEPWSQQVDQKIFQVFGHAPCILYCGLSGFAPAYTGKHTVQVYQAPVQEQTGTEIRKLIGKTPEHEASFRRGVIYAMENLPHRIYVTVDIALVKYETEEVLMARKPHEPLYRFPGGFVDANESFSMAAKRELREETTINAEHGVQFLGDFELNDWRLRDAQGVNQRTMFYVAPYAWGAPRAADDIAEVKWFKINDLTDTNVMAEHLSLAEALKAHIKNKKETRHVAQSDSSH